MFSSYSQFMATAAVRRTGDVALEFEATQATEAPSSSRRSFRRTTTDVTTSPEDVSVSAGSGRPPKNQRICGFGLPARARGEK